jgi:hypothetical protein
MVLSWSATAAARDMDAIIRKMVSDEIAKQTPIIRYGKVKSVDRFNNLAVVNFTDETADVEVSISDTKQVVVGALVKVDMSSPRPAVLEQMDMPYYSPDILGVRAQRNLIGGGAVNWSRTAKILTFSRAFYIHDTGASGFNRGGVWKIPSPAGGIQIPVYRSGTYQTVTTVANGVPLDYGQALYYELPVRKDVRGNSNDANLGNESLFRVVANTASTLLDIPWNWVLIAQIGTQATDLNFSSQVKVGTGAFADAVTAFNILGSNSDFQSYSDPTNFRDYSFYKIGSVLYLTGLGLAKNVGANLILKLSLDQRPAKQLIFTAMSRDGPKDIRVAPDGNVYMSNVIPDDAFWLAIDGISFMVEQ